MVAVRRLINRLRMSWLGCLFTAAILGGITVLCKGMAFSWYYRSGGLPQLTTLVFERLSFTYAKITYSLLVIPAVSYGSAIVLGVLVAVAVRRRVLWYAVVASIIGHVIVPVWYHCREASTYERSAYALSLLFLPLIIACVFTVVVAILLERHSRQGTRGFPVVCDENGIR